MAGCSWPDGQGDSGHQPKLTSIFWRVKSTNFWRIWRKMPKGHARSYRWSQLPMGLGCHRSQWGSLVVWGVNRHRWMVGYQCCEVQSLQLSDIDSQRWEFSSQGDGKQSITRCWELECFGISVRWNWRSRIETVESKLNEVQVLCFLEDFGRFVVWETSSLEMIWRVSSDSCATWKRLWMRPSCR